MQRVLTKKPLLFRSVRFSPDAGGMHHWPHSSHVDKRSQTQASDLDIYNDHENENDTDSDNDKDDDDNENGDHENVGKLKNQNAENRRSIQFSFCGCFSLISGSNQHTEQSFCFARHHRSKERTQETTFHPTEKATTQGRRKEKEHFGKVFTLMFRFAG